MITPEESLDVRLFKNHCYRKAREWRRERESRIFEKLTIFLVIIFALCGILTFPIIFLDERFPIWMGILFYFIYGLVFLGVIVLVALIAERRLERLINNDSFLARKFFNQQIPGFLIFLREDDEFALIKSLLIREAVGEKELEIIDCLILDGSELTFEELISTGRLLLQS